MKITVYTKPRCVQCDLTKRKLDDSGLPYETADITAPEHADRLDEFKASGLLAAPIVVIDTVGAYSDVQRWSGYRPDLIEALG